MNFLLQALFILLCSYCINSAAPPKVLRITEVDEGNIEIYNYGSQAVDMTQVNLFTIRADIGGAPQYTGFSTLSGSLAASAYLHLTLTTPSRKKRSTGTAALSIGTATGKIYGLIVYRRASGEGRPFNYAQIVSDLVEDAVFYSPDSSAETPFSSLKAWTGNYLTFTSGDRLARCSDTLYDSASFTLNLAATFEAANTNCPNPAGNGDPHFIQQIQDSISNTTHNICFDVYGKSNNKIYILNDLRTKTSIYGILKDDFYMHSILITNSNEIFQISTSVITLPNGSTIQWIANDNIVYYDSLSMQITNTAVHINVRTPDGNLKMSITRSKSIASGKYLNIQFINTNPKEERYSGLIGDVGKQSLEFKNTIQSNLPPVFKMGNKMILAKQRFLTDKTCWLLPFKDIIYPKKALDYVY